MIIQTFQKRLNRALATRILYSNKKPDALNDTATKKGWYTIAIEFDRIHRDNVQALDDQTNRQDDNRTLQTTDSDKLMDEATQLAQLTTKEITNNHDMIQMPWISTLSQPLSMR